MHRRRFLTSAAAAAGAAAVGRIAPARAARELLVAEPVHSTGYLPLYIAMAKGYFEDVKVNLVTIETGSGHTNAVLSGQAFAFIGGPEHNAFAKAKGAELRAIVACVDRGIPTFARRPPSRRRTPTGRAISRARPSRSARPEARPIRSCAICSANGNWTPRRT
jgi:ABC-type nitrate/sulfonate/bicarbonate transport system substrate-binding protein